jgi:archaellum component FlaC
MKGVIKLHAEINYNEMIVDDRLEALHAFTGKKTFDELSKLHMDMLGERIAELFRDMPYVKYEIEGSFVSPEQKKTWGEYVAEVEAPTMTLKELQDAHTAMSETANEVQEESEKNSSNKYVEMLDEAVENTSMVAGMPTLITINDAMSIALGTHVDYLKNADTENSIVKTYKGFPVRVEGMEDLFIIEYKDYVSGEVRSITKTL